MIRGRGENVKSQRQRKRQREEEGCEKVGRLVLEMTQSMTFRPKSSSTVSVC